MPDFQRMPSLTITKTKTENKSQGSSVMSKCNNLKSLKEFPKFSKLSLLRNRICKKGYNRKSRVEQRKAKEKEEESKETESTSQIDCLIHQFCFVFLTHGRETMFNFSF